MQNNEPKNEAHIGGSELNAGLGWPDPKYGRKFEVWKKDPSDKHSAWFVVMPNGAMLEFNHNADDAVDEATARWVAETLNAAMTPNV